jgi:DNA invertase Pin-like site-specific DNA recombinase
LRGLAVYALDRVARNPWELAQVVREVEGRGEVPISVREEWLQQLDPKIRQLVVSVLGWAAEMEREFIRERTREALARLRAQGRRVGRPPKWSEQVRRKIIDAEVPRQGSGVPRGEGRGEAEGVTGAAEVTARLDGTRLCLALCQVFR